MTVAADRKNVFEWLDEVRERPGMYLGETSRPLEDLQMLVHGYSAALHAHNLIEEGPSMDHFSTWLRFRTTWSTSCGWASAITTHTASTAGLASFFTFVDEFRRLLPLTLSTVALTDRHQPTGKRSKVGFDGRIQKPDRVDAVRYVPEPIYFLRFHYGPRLANQHTLYTSDGSDATTLDHAKEWVHDEFSVDPADWQDP
jgi:hypothetical protein